METSVTVTVNKKSAPPTVTVVATPAPPLDVTEQRLRLFRKQEQAVQGFYQTYADPTDRTVENTGFPTTSQSLFYIANKQSQYVETAKLQTALCLNSRDVASLELIQPLFDNLYVVDDMLMAIVAKMPPQRPLGWQLVSLNQNLLNLPTIGQQRANIPHRNVEASVAATVLQFFGVSCFTLDKGYFIGHVVGYLFCCYYFAHLGVAYSATSLTEQIVNHYPSPTLAYGSVGVPELVRLLQELDESVKQQVYQLAVYAAQMSEYTLDKRIERMLIAEVNSFDKQGLRDEISQIVMYGDVAQAALFQGLKPYK